MNVRAKFQVQSHEKHASGATTVRLSPCYDMSIPEDQRFNKATPSGSMQLYIDNPSAVEALELGKYFYVDFTPVPAT